ncbi:UDP-N-acetylmuramoyl-L-alanyl-D-glutamate--2,6-diaminopimelate ligase [Pseudahrensia aquimaris]|uniref:UDP-N-acetylmuramoyl-L-alanyl-D-glutamate--2,6-diaminopimelate ligase n=1 Tax=Pseudahrensia aquimaris TaxID=744461 RepID=A0ABW3FHJ4_9HYPH
MKLSELLVEGASLDGADVTVSSITMDSRKVMRGSLFAALKGTDVDGASYIPAAIEAGAVAVLADADTAACAVPIVRSDDPRRTLALMAAKFHPRQPSVMAAVTGTAGKTSVASFLRQIWESCGEQAAMIGTTGVFAPGRADYGSLTTPDPVLLHELLDELAGSGVSHCSMEASSHGLDQRRLDGVNLAVAGFTNLGRDHMDYHPTVEHYLASKMRLFDTLMDAGKPAIIYADDAYSAPAIAAAEAAGLDVKTVGRAGNFIALKRVEQRQFTQEAELDIDGEIHFLSLPMAGEFQLANALVAAGMAIATGSDPAAVLAALKRLKGAPGRLELIGQAGNGAPAYVDYAHKPEALENVLKALRPYTTGKLVVVFGCGGDRDPGKRPIMGEIAQRLADLVIVTDDNPRTEKPSSIRAQILEATPDAIEIGDRKKAIEEAVAKLEAGDCLVVAGKGHEEGQIVGKEVLPFSDHKVLAAALEATL